MLTPQIYNEKKIKPIDYIEANGLDFAEGNIIKYVTRYKSKNGLEDLLKARYYLNRLIENYPREPLDLERLRALFNEQADDNGNKD